MRHRPGSSLSALRLPRGAPLLSLTYDDGPGESLTPRVLDALAARDAKATFFLLGRRAAAAPGVADRVRDAGHEIGCHSHGHLHAWKTPPWRSAADVARGYETLSAWLPSPCLFRPPYGKLTPWTARAARRRGSRIVKWTVDSGDTWSAPPRVEDVVERVRRDGGGVVLLHDFDREGEDAAERAAFVVGVTEALLEAAPRQGWRVATLGEMLSEMEGAA